jgi:hypothetical protein
MTGDDSWICGASTGVESGAGASVGVWTGGIIVAVPVAGVDVAGLSAVAVAVGAFASFLAPIEQAAIDRTYTRASGKSSGRRVRIITSILQEQ